MRTRWAARIAAAACVAALGLAGHPVRAEYPERTVRFVVPYGTGGGIDAFTRAIAQRLGELWGKPVIVENRPGGGTSVGTDAVAKSAPDGHTLLMNASSIAINFGTIEKLPFKPSDLAPVAMAARSPMVLVVGTAVPADSMKALIELSATRPGGMTLASSGQAGIGHLALELLRYRSALKLTHVPYKSNSASIPDIVAGRVDGFIATAAGVIPPIRQGQVKPIAVTSTTRFSTLPDVPTMIESGVPGYDLMSWFGVFAPAGTPAPVLDRIHRDLNAVLRRPDMAQVIASQGLELADMSRDEFRAAFEAEVKTWVTLIRETGLKFE